MIAVCKRIMLSHKPHLSRRAFLRMIAQLSAIALLQRHHLAAAENVPTAFAASIYGTGAYGAGIYPVLHVYLPLTTKE